MKTSLALASLVAIVKAISFTSPALNAQWDLSQPNVISWSYVDTDPTSFSLVLVNHDTKLPVTPETIVSSVSTSAGSYTVSNLVAPSGNQYTIKAISISANDSGQLAESQTFSIKSGSGGTQTTSPSTSTISATGYGSGSTTSATISGTGSSPSFSLTSGGPGASASSSSTGTISHSNTAATLGQTFAMAAGPLAALLAMLL